MEGCFKGAIDRLWGRAAQVQGCLSWNGWGDSALQKHDIFPTQLVKKYPIPRTYLYIKIYTLKFIHTYSPLKKKTFYPILNVAGSNFLIPTLEIQFYSMPLKNFARDLLIRDQMLVLKTLFSIVYLQIKFPFRVNHDFSLNKNVSSVGLFKKKCGFLFHCSFFSFRNFLCGRNLESFIGFKRAM